MIIGNGDIGTILKKVDRDDLLFFASGVSNSQETDEEEYYREVSLLREHQKTILGADKPENAPKRLVYFSSLSIFYSNTRYTQHKKHMEKAIQDLFPRWTIIRLGNITWGDNPNTLINFFKNKLKNGEKIEIRDEFRYLVDEGEFLHWMRLIPSGDLDWNCEMNITGKRIKVAEIVEEYCKPPVYNNHPSYITADGEVVKYG